MHSFLTSVIRDRPNSSAGDIDLMRLPRTGQYVLVNVFVITVKRARPCAMMMACGVEMFVPIILL